MTKLDLDAAERLCNAATPGPWKHTYCGYLEGPNDASLTVGDHGYCGGFGRDADAEFAAASRTLIPALIAELRAARAVVEAVEPLVNEWRDQPKFADRVFDLRNAVVKAYAAAVEGGGT